MSNVAKVSWLTMRNANIRFDYNYEREGYLMGMRRRILLTILLLVLVFITVAVVYIISSEKVHDYRGTFVENMCKEVI